MSFDNPHLAHSLLHDVAALPELSLDLESEPRWARTAVIAPHPDDESLACGGLVARLRRAGCEVDIVIMSDGAGSHPHSRSHPRARLVALRRAEAERAATILGVERSRVHFLEQPDGAVPGASAAGFGAAVESLRHTLDELAPSTVLAPWRRDKHRDHEATCEIVHAAYAGSEVRILEYPVWVWDAEGAFQTPTAREVRGWRLPIADVADEKARAIAAHASQLTDLVDDDPSAFRMAPHQLVRFQGPEEVFFEQLPRTAADASLPREHFEARHQSAAPWDEGLSAHARGKHELVLGALSQTRYQRALEIGCSIGELSRRLAARTDELLALDISERAVSAAALRCCHLENIEFRRQQIPTQWPEGSFDLVLLSEVGLYLSSADLETLRQQAIAALRPGGELLLVHWRPMMADLPQHADSVHDYIAAAPELSHCRGQRVAGHRLDLLRRC